MPSSLRCSNSIAFLLLLGSSSAFLAPIGSSSSSRSLSATSTPQTSLFAAPPRRRRDNSNSNSRYSDNNQRRQQQPRRRNKNGYNNHNNNNNEEDYDNDFVSREFEDYDDDFDFDLEDDDEEPPNFDINSGTNTEASATTGAHFFSRKPLEDPSFVLDASDHDTDIFDQLCRGAGIARPSRVQSMAWPVLLQGKHTIVADQTGSGKEWLDGQKIQCDLL